MRFAAAEPGHGIQAVMGPRQMTGGSAIEGNAATGLSPERKIRSNAQ
jgi:hypothetical protein